MPEAMGTGLYCRNAGYLGPKVGRFNLSPRGLDIRLMEYVRGITSDENPLDTRTSLRHITALNAQSIAVSVAPPLMPAVIMEVFRTAGKGYELDFRYCKSIIFLPYLRENGEWAFGFEISMVNGNGAEVNNFLRQAPELKPDIKNMIFIHPFDEQGNPASNFQIFCSLGWLLGRIKVSALLISRGLSTDTLGQSARKVFAYLYLEGMLERLKHTASRGPSIPDKQLIQSQIGGIKEQVARPLSFMTSDEVQIVLELLG